MDMGNDVAGPALTSPVRHSVPHWYGFIPRRDIAGAGPEEGREGEGEDGWNRRAFNEKCRCSESTI